MIPLLLKVEKKILLFCSKIKKEDIEVLFLHYGKNGEEILTTKGDFGEANVHDQSGISFKTPPYPDLEITEAVKVSICLRQPSKNVQSEPQDFWYVPSPSKVQARNTSLDNDLKQKIRMIQRIAEEAKLTDMDIKIEEKGPQITQQTYKTGTFTPPPTSIPMSTDNPVLARLGKQNKSMPIKLPNVQKSQASFQNSTGDSAQKGQSRFPLTGSYGGIISINSDSTEGAKGQHLSTDDSGFISGLATRNSGMVSRNVMLKANEPTNKEGR